MAVMRLGGIELYAADLGRSRTFYEQMLGLEVSEEESGHRVMFSTGEDFLCLETPGAEIYPSQDKTVVFFVADLAAVVNKIGRDRFVKHDATSTGGWSVLHDPDGHNVLLL